MKFNVSKLLPFIVVLIVIAQLTYTTTIPIDNQILIWSLNICVLVILILSKKNYLQSPNSLNLIPLQIFLIWNIVCIIRGAFEADNYWESKNLVTSGMVLLLPISVYVSTNVIMVQRIFFMWIKYFIPAFFFILPFFKTYDAIGRYLVPFILFLLFFPFLSKKWKLISIVSAIVVIFSSLDARSNVIKFSASMLLGLLFYFPSRILVEKLLPVFRLLFLFGPIVLFVLALNGSFNVFKMDEYISGDYTISVEEKGREVEEISLTTDTRTALYEEVLSSAAVNNYLWFGRTPARGNDSELFGSYSLDVLKTGKMERYVNEVSILNIFTWTGVIGVFLYFLIFFWSSYLAIFKSNNFIIKIVGLYIAFRWSYAWIEDFSNFDLSYFILWIMIGMGISKSFRQMNNVEIKIWIRSLFNTHYQQMYLNYLIAKYNRDNSVKSKHKEFVDN